MASVHYAFVIQDFGPNRQVVGRIWDDYCALSRVPEERYQRITPVTIAGLTGRRTIPNTGVLQTRKYDGTNQLLERRMNWYGVKPGVVLPNRNANASTWRISKEIIPLVRDFSL